MKKILVAYDGSESANRAFHVALELAEGWQATLLVMAIINVPETRPGTDLAPVLTEAHAQLETVFSDLRGIASGKGVTLETAVEAGNPAEHILARAERESYDHIVIGRRGLSRVERWVIGSVSERVLRYAHCPVTVVK